MNIDKINQALAARDKAMNDANVGHGRKVAELQEAFAVEQKALAQKYVDAEMASLAAANAAVDAAVKGFDKALADLAAEDARSLGAPTTPPTPGPKPTDKSVLTAADVAKTFLSADLKAAARKLGLATTGSEVVLAQRLLDAGWKP